MKEENEKDLNKLSTLCNFLNDLASQLSSHGKERNKEVIGNIHEAVEFLRDDLVKAIKDGQVQLKQNKLTLTEGGGPPIWQTKINLPEQFDFTKVTFNLPETISLKEAEDIVNILKLIVMEIKRQDLEVNVDFTKTERLLENVYDVVEESINREDDLHKRTQKGIEGKLDQIKKAIPKFDLPMEKGRIKVILPDSQVTSTKMGAKVEKEVRGVFLGGQTTNPTVGVRNNEGKQIDPATEGGNLSHLANIPGISIPIHDSVEMEYTGDDMTKVIYKNSGDIVATLELTYTDGNLTKVEKV